MAKAYIRPEDVSAEDAGIILDFFNSAQSAEQIAETIEIPGELDVGLRVAQRILDRRNALEGGFESLDQIRSVPYVGPERFTEIVTVLTGMQPAAITSGTDFQARVLHELQTLRNMVAALQADAGQPRNNVTLRATRENGFVGQPIPIIAEVKDRASGRPRPNVRLTVTAGWGSILSHVGFEQKQGRAVTVYTDLNGKAELVFYPPTAEIMTEAQQAALETALRELDPDAHSPLEVGPQLEQMVRRYRADSDKELRSAIDIYFGERQEQLTQAENPGAAMGSWPYCRVAITAYVHEAQQSTSVQSMAVLNLGLKDWLRPWYITFLSLTEKENHLREDIDAISSETQDSAQLLDGILGNVYSFIGIQTGRVGEAAGQMIAKKAVNYYMASGFDQLPLESRQSLFPALSIAAKSIRADTMGSLAVSTRIRKEVKTDMAVQLEPLGDVALFAEKVDTVKGDLERFDSDYNKFNVDYGAFNESIDKFDIQYATFDTNYKTFDTNYKTFDTDFRSFSEKNDTFTSKYDTFTSTYDTFDTDSKRFDENMSAFNQSYTTFNTRYNSFNNNLGTFTTNYDKFKTDYTKFRTDFDTRPPIR